jgi:flagellar protein FlaJ
MQAKRMPFVEEKLRYAVYASSAAIFFFFMILALLLSHYKLNLQYVVPTGPKAGLGDDLMGIGLLVALIPVAVVSFINFRYVSSVEKNIPRFLNDILESTDSGEVLPSALINAAKRDYGPISYEMGIAMTKFSLGYPFSDSVNEAGKRLKHPYGPQVALIISEAYSAGGRTHDVLQSSVNLFNGLEEYNAEKQSELKPYVQLVYISIGIFLLISVLIITRFVLPFENVAQVTTKLNAPEGAQALSSSFSRLNLSKIPSASYFDSIFFFSALIESVFGGIVAGKIADGSASAGLRHSILLIAITIIVFSIPGVGLFN